VLQIILYSAGTIAFDVSTADSESAKGHKFNVWMYLGDAYRSRGNFEGAIMAFEKAFEKDSSSPGPWSCLRRAYSAKGDLDVALKTFEIAVQQYPDAWIGLGAICEEGHEYDRAIEAYETTIQLDPKLSAICHRLGTLYRAKDDYDSAIKTLKRGIEC